MAQFTLTTFTPGEAEKITGLSTGMQRDWRKRGLLPSNDGHARFDLFSLAEMLAFKLLSDRGVGPQTSREVMPWVTVGIAYQVLLWVDAYEGDHLKTNEARGLPPRSIDPEAMEHFAPMLEASGISRAELENRRNGFDGQWLSHQVILTKGYPRVIPAKFFIWWADGSHVFTGSLDRQFSDGSSSDARWAGPVVVLDLEGLASTLLAQAGRPFVHVEFETNESGDFEPPMERKVFRFSVQEADPEISVETTPTLPQKDL